MATMYTWDPITGTYVLSDTGTYTLNDTGAYVLSPIVTTDLADYAPGSTATFTANVGVGDTVTFNVTDVAGTAVSGTDQPWTITDGGFGDLDGVANGVIQTTWAVGLDAAGEAFVLTATDLTAGLTATASFTDTPHTPVPAIVPVALNNGIVFLTGDVNTATGTGIFPAFVQIQGDTKGSDPTSYDNDGLSSTEEGFNTLNPPIQDSDSSPVHNHPLLFSAVPTVVVDGITYREFRLDLNDQGTTINLDALKIYRAAVNDLTTLSGATELYNMDGGTDGVTGGALDVNVSVILTAWASGSGHSDYKVLIPDFYFASANAGDYIYLYSAFSDANSGFEEWSVGPVTPTGPAPHASVSLTKDTVCPDDGHSIANGSVLAGNAVEWTYAVTNTGNVGLNNVVVTDDNGTPDDGNPLNGDETLDDFTATPVTVTYNSNLYNIGDLNHNGIVDADDPTTALINEAETWQFIATGTAVAGAYANTATVTTDATGFSTPPADLHPSGFDISSYFGLNPHITLNKLTNGSDGPNLLQGQAITWTYDVTNDGNVDLTGVSVSDNPSQTITPILSGGFNSGDLNHDGILNADDPTTLLVNEAETWHYQATGIAGSTAYSNTATATTAAITDDCGDSRIASDTDDSNYTGHGQTLAGLTKGYWSTHLTLWDVYVGDEKGAGAELNVAPGYDWNHNGTTAAITLANLTTSGPSSSLGLVKTANNGGGDSGLLMGDLNHDGLVGGDGSSDHLFFDLASAQILANSSVSGDARIILGSQAVAAQLNEYADYVYDQAHGGVTAGFDASPTGLIEEAVLWLKGTGLISNGDSKVNWSTANDLTSPTAVQAIIDLGNNSSNPLVGTNDYTISGGAITFKSTSMPSSDASWNHFVAVFNETTAGYHPNTGNALVDATQYTVTADGEGLKNALAAYNHGLDGTTAGFVVSTDGTLIGWQDSLGGTVYDVHANTVDAFWGILEDQNLLGVHPIAGIGHV